jgi:hypothetical protein
MIMGLSARFWLTPVIFWGDHPLAVPLFCCERTGHPTMQLQHIGGAQFVSLLRDHLSNCRLNDIRFKHVSHLFTKRENFAKTLLFDPISGAAFEKCLNTNICKHSARRVTDRQPGKRLYLSLFAPA